MAILPPSTAGAKQLGPLGKSSQKPSYKFFCSFILEISLFVKFDAAFAIIISGLFKGYMFKVTRVCRRWY